MPNRKIMSDEELEELLEDIEDPRVKDLTREILRSQRDFLENVSTEQLEEMMKEGTEWKNPFNKPIKPVKNLTVIDTPEKLVEHFGQPTEDDHLADAIERFLIDGPPDVDPEK